MKRICILLLAILFSALCASAAMAEAETFSIKELPGVTSSRWKQTYEAYGRTFDVNVDIRRLRLPLYLKSAGHRCWKIR